MKSLLALTFSFLVLFQSAGLGLNDLFLLGSLAEHAQYHSENYGDDFFTFIAKHYGSQKTEHQKNNKEEKQEQGELPFQHISCHHVIGDVVLVPCEVAILKVEISIQGSHTFYYQNLYSSLKKVSIFQPPKFA